MKQHAAKKKARGRGAAAAALAVAAMWSLVVLLGAWHPAGAAPPKAPPAEPRQVFHTQRLDIVFDQRRQLEELASRLGVRPPEVGMLALRLDAMLTEVARVLNRGPAPKVKLTIRLLPDALAVQRQHRLLTGAGSGGTGVRGPLPSFYEPRSRTMYLSLADARVGVVAHEMVHFILCESGGAWPGEAFQESLARYLEERFNTGRSGP